MDVADRDDMNRELSVAIDHPDRSTDTGRLQALCGRVLESEGIGWINVGVVLTTSARVHELNRDFLGHDYETDVLTFLLENNPERLEGEVYVDLDMAAENAIRFGTTYDREVARYVVHGMLHLAGHDDESDEDRAAMTVLEDRYLETWDSAAS